VKIVEPTLYDLLALCGNARADEIMQYEALVGPWSACDAAVGFYTRTGLKFAGVNGDGVAICAGGWDEIIPGVWQSWMVGTDEYWRAYWRSITKYSRRIMDELLYSGTARRLQTGALAARTAACEWYVRGLNMVPEGVCKNYGLGGEDMATFARVKESDNG